MRVCARAPTLATVAAGGARAGEAAHLSTQTSFKQADENTYARARSNRVRSPLSSQPPFALPPRPLTFLVFGKFDFLNKYRIFVPAFGYEKCIQRKFHTNDDHHARVHALTSVHCITNESLAIRSELSVLRR